jgi:hypothetical protein
LHAKGHDCRLHQHVWAKMREGRTLSQIAESRNIHLLDIFWAESSGRSSRFIKFPAPVNLIRRLVSCSFDLTPGPRGSFSCASSSKAIFNGKNEWTVEILRLEQKWR